MANVIVFGTGQIAELVSYFLDNDSEHEIVGYTVNEAYISEPTFLGKPVVAWENLESKFPPSDYYLFCPLSYRNLNQERRDKYQEGKNKGYRFITYIHSSSLVSTKKVGENCLILERCTLQPYSSIGDNVVLWTSTHIGHHSKVGDHCFIAGTGGIAGNTTIGEGTFIGGYSGVGDNVIVGKYCLIGINSIVVRDLEDETVYATKRHQRVKPGIARQKRFGALLTAKRGRHMKQRESNQ